MWENFKNWIDIKFKIHQTNRRPFFNEREIWWANFGQNIGDEENGKGVNYMRPVIVIKKYNTNICMIIPVSSRIKDNIYYFKIKYKGSEYSALLSHARTIDAKRLRKIITSVTHNQLDLIKQAYIQTIR
jgi:mRNA-degrading endonuclease toxin of MazEF toxin-antitoxin module